MGHPLQIPLIIAILLEVLFYFDVTRSDISYIVHILSQFVLLTQDKPLLKSEWTFLVS